MAQHDHVAASGPTPPQAEALLETIERDGYVVLAEWLPATDVAAAREEFERLQLTRPSWCRIEEAEGRTFLHFSPLAKRLSGSASEMAVIDGVFNHPLFRTLCDRYLGAGWFCDRILFEHNLPDTEPIQPWHVDHFPVDERCLKFFVYLTDVTPATGSFCYVPGWHRLLWRFNTEIESYRQRQADLHMFDQIIARAESWIGELRTAGKAAEAEKVERLLQDTTAHIHGRYDSDDHFAISAKAGSVIIFDPAGLHRGGVVSRGERLVVRSHCLQQKAARAFLSRGEFLTSARRTFTRTVDRVTGKQTLV